MLSTLELTKEKILNHFHGKGRMCALKITNKCTHRCDTCIESSSPDEPDTLMSDEIILEVFKHLKGNKYAVSIQGGEAMLYPDKCLLIAEQCRKTDTKLVLTSNCFWGNDDNMIKFFNEELRPDFLLASIDYWHQKQIPIEYIDNIVRKMDPKIMIVSSPITSKSHPSEEIKTEQQWYRAELPLVPLGRAENMKNEVFYRFYDEDLYCGFVGIAVAVDGSVHASCRNECYSCKLGKLPGSDLTPLLNLPRPKIHLKGYSYGFAEACYLKNINILDEKWKDPNYIENIEL